MPSETAAAIAYVGAFIGLVGGGVALFNSWKAVGWKRAELANTYPKDYNSNDELVFAGRCLDWTGGKLVLPERLRPYMPDGAHCIQHDRRVLARPLRPDPQIGGMDEGPRIWTANCSSWPTSRTLVNGWPGYEATSLSILSLSRTDIGETLKS